MKYVSEQFNNAQNEIIRPALQIHFEVGSNVNFSEGEALLNDGNTGGFDDTVAPVIDPDDCTNGYFYAVVGDAVGVDNPNRICAPDNSGDFSTPEHTVPFGITPLVAANTETMIGNNDYYNNFVGFPFATTLYFKGFIPDTIRVEIYDFDTDTWSTETTIDNSELSEEVLYTPADPSQAGNFRRFYVKNTTESGRFQLLWVRSNVNQTVIFENDLVSSCNVDLETDLTSQTLPQYDMTVECLDVEEEYTPETVYWDNQFTDGSPCFLKVGYEIGGAVEYIPILYGTLNQRPTYSEGKLTFSVSFKDNNAWDIDFSSVPDSTVSAGDIVKSTKFSDIIANISGLEERDIFVDQTDDDNSICNYYGLVKESEAKQLIANALGGFMTAGISKYNLFSAIAVQYRLYDNYLLRNDQIQCSLESQAKAGKIEVSRYENTMLSEYFDVTSASTTVTQGDNEVNFIVPFYAFGRMTAMSFPTGYSLDSLDYQTMNEDGTSTAHVIIYKSSSGSATRTFTVRFYKVKSEEFKETEELTANYNGEVYENNNRLVTNRYIANKVKGVAHIVTDTSYQYEVDLMQNFKYEIGDVIRLETQKDVFKSCIITGLQYVFPGSAGHITCKKIYSLLDCPNVVYDPNGLEIKYKVVYDPDWFTNTVLETSENGIVVGLMKFDESESLFFALGVTEMKREHNGTEISEYLTNFLTDLNGHKWGFVYHFIDSDYFETNAPVVQLPDYDAGAGAESVHAYGIINLLREIYAMQGMTAPVDYTCTVEQIH